MKRKLIDLMAQRSTALSAAESAYSAGNEAEYGSCMETVNNLNAEIEKVQNLIREQERQVVLTGPSEAEARDMAEERCNDLLNGREVTLSTAEILRGVRNADGDGTAFGSTIAQPIGAGANINDNLGVCSLLDLVRVQDMTGMSGWAEPYVDADMAATVNTIGTISARTPHDPTFGVSEIKPYEVTTTSYVDRNIRKASPAAYMAKIQEMALRALKNKAAALILLGDAEVSHVMYGMQNGTNKAGSSLVKTIEATVTNGLGVVDVDLLDNLYFEYGDGYTVGGNGIFLANKADIKALGKLRGTNEKGRLFGITPMAGDACRGTIADGGLIVPYIISSALTAVNGTEQAASSGADKLCCIFGDPMNYLLGLFGGYTIRIDESYKAAERLDTVLGDMLIGGNVVAKDGFVVAKIAKAAASA